jgi:hypothetical protein
MSHLQGFLALNCIKMQKKWIKVVESGIKILMFA